METTRITALTNFKAQTAEIIDGNRVFARGDINHGIACDVILKGGRCYVELEVLAHFHGLTMIQIIDITEPDDRIHHGGEVFIDNEQMPSYPVALFAE